ncbi:MAG: anthranilate synthase component I [Oscillatoriales cyanobacterium SM2_1_8]|nr:anthranilate synthase component I [Oscillatoriales cyanobacterium SM2_1_8]
MERLIGRGSSKDIFWQEISGQGLRGRDVDGAWLWERLFADSPVGVLLDCPLPGPLARYAIAAGFPAQTYTAGVGEVGPLLTRLEVPQAVAAPAGIPFAGGHLGWLGYDWAWELEKLPQRLADPLPWPVAFWFEPSQFAVWDSQRRTLWLGALSAAGLRDLQQRWQTGSAPESKPPWRAGGLSWLTEARAYREAVQRVKACIEVGDIFQANLSLRFQVAFGGDGWATYRQLRAIDPAPFASYWRTPWGEILSASPERLLQVQPTGGTQRLATRPIAGTRRRGDTLQGDADLAAELLATVKERTEHLMLVDLARNDLGRVCRWGTVQVDELYTIERYARVMHLVSNVQGESDRPWGEAVAALFPGGTITGCPKVRCMEILEEVEPVRRSLFYGSLGYIDYRGHSDLNILIRTLLRTGDTLYGQVGAGIVADSDPEREWEECLHKAAALCQAIGL